MSEHHSEHDVTVLEQSDTGDSGHATPNSTTLQLNSLSDGATDSDFGVPDPTPVDDTDSQPVMIPSTLSARQISNLLASSLAVTHSRQASFVSDVLNKIPSVTTLQICRFSYFFVDM